MPKPIEQWMYPINKTDLDVLRFAHFLRWRHYRALLPRLAGLKSPWLRPLILCGQHSWRFSASGVPGLCGHFVLAESPGRLAAFVHSACRDTINVRRGVAVFVVHSTLRQGVHPGKKAPPATGIWSGGG